MLVAGRTGPSNQGQPSTAEEHGLGEVSFEQAEAASAYWFSLSNNGQCHYGVRRNVQGEYFVHAADYWMPPADDDALRMDGLTAARRAREKIVIVMCDWHQNGEAPAFHPLPREEDLVLGMAWSRLTYATRRHGKHVYVSAPNVPQEPKSFQSEPFIGEKVSTSKLNLAQMRRISRTRSI